ncbi:Lrp/AsnC family transcriptional regulator [Halorubrum sp. HHNYT27]|uniref:Lrp/AsnC family transcriptional regulator n=1 Tax=Halorubrum sp. HHNYT27 TaxID=3402275 RepID=UPI003EC01BFE
MARKLDNVDRGILYMLQIDARNTTSQDIADKVGVSASTVRNRIERLENDGVITGYQPKINYEEANLPFRVMFVVTAPPTDRGEVVENLMDLQGVVDVREMLTGRRNIHVEVVGKSTEDIVRVTDNIHEMGVEVDSSEIMKQRKSQPFNHFYFSESLVETQEDGESAE